MTNKNTIDFLLNNDSNTIEEPNYQPQLISGLTIVQNIPRSTPGSKKFKKTHSPEPTTNSFKRPYNLYVDLHLYEEKSLEKKKKFQENEEGELKQNRGKWSSEEHEAFVKGLKEIGRRWTEISKHYVKTRNSIQVTSYSQKFLGTMTNEISPSKKKKNK